MLADFIRLGASRPLGFSTQLAQDLFQGLRFGWFDEVVVEAGFGGAAAVFVLAPTGEGGQDDMA